MNQQPITQGFHRQIEGSRIQNRIMRLLGQCKLGRRDDERRDGRQDDGQQDDGDRRRHDNRLRCTGQLNNWRQEGKGITL